MATPVFTEVDQATVAPVRLTDTTAQTVLAFRNRNKVDMVWHQAVRPDGYTALPAPISQQGEIGQVVLIAEESLHSPVAALGNMVRDAGGYDTRDSGHIRRLIEAPS